MSQTLDSQEAGATTGARTPSWGALLVLLAGIFVVTLDFFIVNVAIPGTQRDLSASPAAVQWIVAGFALALASGLVLGGRLGDLYGRRRLFALGLALFTLASAACGAAPNVSVLITGRVAQGAAAALLMPQVLGVINVVYTGAYRVRAFTAYGLAMGVAAVFGQLIGGGLIQADVLGLGWRAIYWITVPLGVASLALAPRLVPESRGTGRAGVDPLGTALVTIGLVAVVLPLVDGREQGWPAWTWACLAAAPVVLAVFGWHQRWLGARGGAPLLELRLFRERGFSVGLVVALVYMMAMSSFFLVLALYLQEGRGLSALDSGLVFSAMGAAYLVASICAPGVAARIGRQVLTVGALVQAAGYGALAAAVRDGAVWNGAGAGALGWLFPGLVLAGCGMGLVLAPMISTVLAGITPRHAAAAAGVLSTAQQVGGALGVAVIGIVFYGALGTVAHAFTASLLPLALCCVAVAVVAQLLPRT
jgi:EmrB/QacA subfamily drug resistance transporter